MIKIVLYYLFCMLFLSSCQTDYVLLDSFRGNVVDQRTNEPLQNVAIYSDARSIDSPILTDVNGEFVTDAFILPHSDKNHSFRRGMSYYLVFQSQGYVNDTIDVRSLGEDIETLDTIDLGIIYLTPLEE